MDTNIDLIEVPQVSELPETSQDNQKLISKSSVLKKLRNLEFEDFGSLLEIKKASYMCFLGPTGFPVCVVIRNLNGIGRTMSKLLTPTDTFSSQLKLLEAAGNPSIAIWDTKVLIKPQNSDPIVYSSRSSSEFLIYPIFEAEYILKDPNVAIVAIDTICVNIANEALVNSQRLQNTKLVELRDAYNNQKIAVQHISTKLGEFQIHIRETKNKLRLALLLPLEDSQRHTEIISCQQILSTCNKNIAGLMNS